MDIDLTFGAFLVGTLVGVMLYGMTILQIYYYCRTYSDDTVTNKVLVFAVATLETFHTVACAHVCYFYLVTSYPNPKALSLGVWSIDIAVGLTGMIVVLSQSFFARRVYLVGPSFRFLVLVAVVLLIGELGFFVAATAEAFVIPELVRFQRVTWLISTGTVMAVVADGLLTSVLVTVLGRSNIGMKRTDTIVDLLILYTVSTGLLTSVVDFSSFIFSLVSRTTLIYSAFGIVATKLYANSLLAALNSRKYLAERAAADIFSCSIINVEATRELPGSGQFARAMPTIFRLSTIITQTPFASLTFPPTPRENGFPVA